MTDISKNELTLDGFQGPASGDTQFQNKPRNMISQTFNSFAAVSRHWVSEFTRVTNWVEDIKSLHLPIADQDLQPVDETEHVEAPEQRIAPTAIVLLGLGELIFVAFLVGRTYGTLHPVWKVIVGLSVCGIAGFSVRLIRLIRDRRHRSSAGRD